MPLDHLAAREAFRARLLTFVAATTGTTTLGADVDGFTRAAGSFITDGFAAGMEVAGAGFPGTVGDSAIVKTVSALNLKIEGGRTATAPAAARSLTVSLPQDRRWQGTQTPVSTAVATRPNVLEQWVPGITRDYGAIVDTGFYVVTLNALANRGINAVMREMQKIRDLFPPGTQFFIGSDMIRVTGDPAPSFSQPVTTANGYETSSLRIPWRAVTTNLDPV